MARVTMAAIASDPPMTEAANAVLAKGGSSVDACIAAFFAAAGADAGPLLGSTVMLVAGTGAGSFVFDGSVVQPGRGAPRPRGFIEEDDVPVAARIPVPSVGAMLNAAHAHGGALRLSDLATPGVRLARAQHAPGRASLLRRVGDSGPVALREPAFLRGLLEVAGRPENGNVTDEDILQVKADVVPAVVGDGIVHPGKPEEPFVTPSFETRLVVSCDRRGVIAALRCAFDPEGVEVVPHQVTASRFAVPVRRGVPRVRPGVRLSMPAPMAILTDRAGPWAAVVFDGLEPPDWQSLPGRLAPGITLEQSLRELVSCLETAQRVLAVVRDPRAGHGAHALDVMAEA